MKKCSTNKNPGPPCMDGFYKAINKKGEECCYKNKKTIQNSKNTNNNSNSGNTDSNTDNGNHKFLHTMPNHNTNPETWVLPNKTSYTKWLTNTFIDYKKNVNSQESSCEIKADRLTLFPHQRFIRDYLQYKSPYRGLLIYHGLGVGKSCSSIAAAEMLLNFKQVVIMLPASLKSNYISEISKCGNKYYDKSKHHWIFMKNMKVSYVSDKTSKKNGGVFIIDESEPPNYDSMSDIDKNKLNLQINDIIKNNYHFINYNGVDEKYVRENIMNTKLFDDKVVIIDEAHNFISGVSNQSKINTALFKLLMNANNIKIILLSGTPIINKPNEIAYTINLIKGYEYLYSIEVEETNQNVLSLILDSVPEIDSYQIEILTKTSKLNITLVPYMFKTKNSKLEFSNVPLTREEIIKKIIRTIKSKNIKYVNNSVMKFTPLPQDTEEFNKFFINETDLLMQNKNLFMRRILGSVSHFVNNDPRLYPTMTTTNETLVMSNYQFEKYVNARKDEKKSEKNNKNKGLFGNEVSVYKTYSRAICNFVFPENINRPKPKEIVDKNKKEIYKKEVKNALDSLSVKHLKDELEMYSPKFKKILENVQKSQGTVLIYSQFSSVEGIEILSKCLNLTGYSEFHINYKNNTWDIQFDENKPTYIRFKSELNLDEKKKIEYTNILLSIYNNEFSNLPSHIKKKLEGKTNLHGELVKILFITQSGAEGISLKNVRQVHITEPYWNKNRIDQVIGRANRTCSHIALPPSERNFIVYTYTMTFAKEHIENKKHKMLISRYDKNLTTDETIYNLAQNKHKIISEFLECMQKASVDCSLNNPTVGCFSFPVDINDNDKAYTLDISKDMLDSYYKNATIEVKKKAKKVFIKSMNKTFIYITDTGELFDYTLYITTNILKVVGYLKKLDDNKFNLELSK